MEAGQGKLEVFITKKSIIRAINSLPKPQILTLSNLDLLSGRFPVTYLYFYPNPEAASFTSIIESVKCSLAETLSYYYPFAGRIVQNPVTAEPEIVCDNNGALVVEGHANISLKKLEFYNLNQCLQGKLVSISPDFPLHVQVTHYTCGGISIAFNFDHALDIINMPTTNILLKRLYHIDASSINKLQHIACANGNKRTKIEAFSAYIWKIMVTAIDKKHERCKMGWLVDGRGRMHGAQDPMSDYIGNVLSVTVGEASVAELKLGSISDIAAIVHETISKVTDEKHFQDLIDWIECHRPGLMLPKIVLGRGGPAVVLSSGRRFPVAELNFGFGSPVLGTVCSTIEKIGVGYFNQRPSAQNDGSWTVSAILWPELAAALESDPIFEPMSVNHLQL
ncbi:transferase, putative [Ricinus communis]|uniref:Transferase, putative n=1 Tax=Ricinus communis TaxID=3988 RepID=B9S1N7_RICCO|nr:transferase, putative [Ricinus communis]